MNVCMWQTKCNKEDKNNRSISVHLRSMRMDDDDELIQSNLTCACF